MSNILILNCGSSSVKYMVYDWYRKQTLARGIVERVGMEGSSCTHDLIGFRKIMVTHECPNHYTAIELIIRMLNSSEQGVVGEECRIAAVGHRVVHGGEKFTRSVVIEKDTLKTFEELAALAPLHNPPNIIGIKAAKQLMPNVPHVAVMDTTWHQTMAAKQYIYALPYEWYEKYGVRRYGFHGTSFLYVAKRAAVLLGKDPFECNLICLHIGNGASANAVERGVSFDTSMGFTPLEGLVMGTRAGDHDVAIELHMMQNLGCDCNEMDSILNKKSGLLGISGKYADHRDVFDAAEKGDLRCALARDLEAYRIKKYIGAYFAALGHLDAVVWTAGVGELSDSLRANVMDGLECMEIKYDKDKNKLARSRNAEFNISATNSRIQVLVIPTDEELVMTEDVAALVQHRYDMHTKFRYSFEDPRYRNKTRDVAFAKELHDEPKMALALARPFPEDLLPDEAKTYAWWLHHDSYSTVEQ
jgi:acetate kinase